MRTFGSIVALAAFGCAPLSPQPPGITEKLYPDPDVELSTPAFRKSSGFTTHQELTAFLDALVSTHGERIRIESVGTSQKGRDIPIVFLGNWSGHADPLRVFFQGGLHGDEPASTEGLLHLLQQLLEDPEQAKVLDAIELAVIPCANVDGFERQWRAAANGLDLNRDQTKIMIPETTLLKSAFNAFAPHVAVDFHEFRAYRRDFRVFGKRGVAHLYDVMFLYTGNLNVPASLRSLIADTFVAEARAEAERHDLRSHDYVTTHKYYDEVQFNQGSTNARSSATNFALANTVSSLIEVRGVALGRDSFTRRVMTTYRIASQYLRSSKEHAERVREVLAQTAANRTPVVVRSARRVSRGTLDAVDVALERPIDVEVTVRNALDSIPRLVRKRPYAYLLLPEAQAAVMRLRTLGVQVDQLQSAQSFTVERYRVTEHGEASQLYEGVYRQTVRTEVTQKTMTFPAGTYVVRMDQSKVGLAIETLEPEASNSFVSYSVLETRAGSELPVYRLMSPLDDTERQGER